MSKVTSLGAVLAVSLLAASPAFAQSADAYLDGLYKQAQASGQKEVDIYASSSGDMKPLFDAFQAKYPAITIKPTDIFGPPLQSRLQAEFASTGPQADLIASGEPDMIPAAKNGWLQPFVPDTAKGLPDQLIGVDRMWVGYGTLPMGAIVNTTMVKPADEPKSWKDFVDPKWRGKIAMSSPAGVNGLSQALAAAIKGGVIDQAWLDKMAANKPLYAPGAVASVQMIASGQAALSPVIAYSQYATAKKQGAPLDLVFPSDGVAALPAPFALIAKAPHADAAKLFMAYTMSPAGQAALSGLGQPGTMPGAPPMAGMAPGTKIYILDWKYLQDKYPGILDGFKKTFGS